MGPKRISDRVCFPPQRRRRGDTSGTQNQDRRSETRLKKKHDQRGLRPPLIHDYSLMPDVSEIQSSSECSLSRGFAISCCVGLGLSAFGTDERRILRNTILRHVVLSAASRAFDFFVSLGHLDVVFLFNGSLFHVRYSPFSFSRALITALRLSSLEGHLPSDRFSYFRPQPVSLRNSL